MTNGKKRQGKKSGGTAQGKNRSRAGRGGGNNRNRTAASANAYEGRWNGIHDFYVRSANAYNAERGSNDRGRLSSRLLHEDIAKAHRGIRTQAWGGVNPNEFGQLNPDKDTSVVFDELVGFINGTTGLGVTAHQINPGQSGLFPQLSKSALNYEGYSFAFFEVYVTPIVTVASAGGEGKVVLACDLEGILEAVPDALSELENNTIHSDGMPYEHWHMRLDRVLKHRDRWLVRTGGFPANADPKSMDCGTLYVGTYGNGTTDPIMELRVRGVCYFFDKLEEPVGIPKSILIGQFPSVATPASIVSTVPTSLEWDDANASQGSGRVATINDAGWVLSGTGFSISHPTLSCNLEVFGCISFISSGNYIESYKLQMFIDGVGINTWECDSSMGNIETAVVHGVVKYNAGETVALHATVVFNTGTCTTSVGHLLVTTK